MWETGTFGARSSSIVLFSRGQPLFKRCSVTFQNSISIARLYTSSASQIGRTVMLWVFSWSAIRVCCENVTPVFHTIPSTSVVSWSVEKIPFVDVCSIYSWRSEVCFGRQDIRSSQNHPASIELVATARHTGTLILMQHQTADLKSEHKDSECLNTTHNKKNTRQILYDKIIAVFFYQAHPYKLLHHNSFYLVGGLAPYRTLSWSHHPDWNGQQWFDLWSSWDHCRQKIVLKYQLMSFFIPHLTIDWR